MSQFAEWFVPALLRASLFLTVAALLVAASVKLLRLRSPAGEQWAWLLVLLQGVMFVTLTIPVPSVWFPAQSTALPLVDPSEPVTIPTPPAQLPIIPPNRDIPERAFDLKSQPPELFAEAKPPANPASSAATPTTAGFMLPDRLPSWRMLACIVWLAGLITILSTGFVRYCIFTRTLRAGAPAPAAWVDEWQRVCREAGMHTTIPLIATPDLGPALCRVPSGYRLVLPETMWRTLPAENRRAICRHELEHYRRADLWWTLIVRLLAGVHWFNPCAWWAVWRFEAQGEFACDAAAAGNDPLHFSELLVQLASGRARRVPGVQSVAAGSVYERVQRLLSGGNASRPWRAIVSIAAAAIVICIAGVKLEAKADAPAPGASPKAASSQQDAVTAESPAAKPPFAEPPAAGDQTHGKQKTNPSDDVTGPPDVAADELAGVVVEGDGKPVEGALVDVWNWYPGNETRTDNQGRFRLKKLDSDERVEVRITKEGYTPFYVAQQSVGVKDWKVILTNKTYIEGVITGADGKPAAGAEIRTAFGPVQIDGGVVGEVLTLGKTGPDGKYRLYLTPETYDIQIAAPGQGVKRLTGVVVKPDEAKTLSVTLEPGVRFEAKVVDSATGKPVEGFVLWQWQPPYLVGRSDAEGRITFKDLVPGEVEFQCGGGKPISRAGRQTYGHGPFGRWWSEQASDAWGRKQIDDPATGWQRNFDGLSFELKPEMEPVEIVVERGVSVKGHVTDPEGKPVAGATVAPAKTGSGNSITGDTRYSVKTNEDGRYSVVLPASNAAEYNLIVHDGGYSEWRNWANGVREPMKTKPGQKIENYDLQLTRPAVVRGRVMFSGKPVANREVRTHAFDKLGNRYYDPTAKTDKDGNFELKFVRPGKHYLQVEPFWLSAEDAPGSSIIEVKAGEQLENQDLMAAPQEREMASMGSLPEFQARVLDSDGKPVAGASVGIGLLGGAPVYMASLNAYYAKRFPDYSPSQASETDAEGLADLQASVLTQIRQNTAWIFAVDPKGKRAGTALLNLNDYATADPPDGPQVIDVLVEPVQETLLRFDFSKIPAEAVPKPARVLVVNLLQDEMPLQRLLVENEEVRLLLPKGKYSVQTYEWFVESSKSTFEVRSGGGPAADILLQPSRLAKLIGQPAPEFTQLKPGQSENPTLADFKGQMVILDFWGYWCGPCVAAMPNLIRLSEEFADRGVRVIAVHDDSVQSYDQLQPILERLQKEQWQGQALPFPVLLDGSGPTAIPGADINVNGATTAAYGVTAWPTTLVIGRDGRIQGELSTQDLAAARKRLEELLAAPAP